MSETAGDQKRRGRKWWKFWVAIVGGVVATVAFFADVAQIGTSVKELFAPNVPSQGSSSSSPPRHSDSGPSVGQPDLPGTMQVGYCLTAEARDAPCDGLHSAEIFATGASCSADSLVRYAGGIPQEDVLRSDMAIRFIEDKNLCIVVLPADLHDFGTLRNALRAREHAALRRCFDRLAGSDVPCDVLHTAEVVAVGAALSASACKLKSNQYMNASVDQNFRIVEVAVETTGASAVCVVRARGNNGLIGSLRNTASKAIQVQPLP